MAYRGSNPLPLEPMREYELCDGKRCLSRREANEVVNAARNHHRSAHRKDIPKRAYECPKCGKWHTTSQIKQKKYDD